MPVTTRSRKIEDTSVVPTKLNLGATKTSGTFTGGEALSSPPHGGASKRDVVCPQCLREFETVRGLGQHERAAHPRERDQRLLEKPRAKRIAWLEEEKILVAREEARLERTDVPRNRNGSSGMLNALCKMFTHRTRDTIRGLRKSRQYLEILNECRSRESRSVLVSPESSVSNVVESASRQVRMMLASDRGLTEAGLCKTPAQMNKKFREWARRFDATKRQKRGPPKSRPAIVGNRASRRRKLRAAWLDGYERRPTVTSRRICEGKGLNDRESYPDGMFEFWSDIYEGESRPVGQLEHENWGDGFEELVRPFTAAEIREHMKTMKAGAAGTDGITLVRLRSIKVAELVEWFNCFLRIGAIPKRLKRFRTIFLRKSEGASEPREFRPITIGSYFRRLFDGMIAKRMQCVPTHCSQRGFKKMEGCSINQEFLRAVISEHIKSRKGLNYVFLDVAKAFDSVSHERVEIALKRARIPKVLGVLLLDTLKGNTTTFGTDERIVRIRRGVLQGDPLSPLIFNLVMDVAVRSLEDRIGGTLGGTKVPQLLFADDAVLFGESLVGLQQNVNRFSESLAYFGLSLNAAKCAAVHIRVDGRAKKWFVDSSEQLKVSGKLVRTLGIGESYKYLGLRLSLGKCTTNVLDECESLLGNISASVVKPQHKLQILQVTGIPKIEYVLVNGKFTLGVLSKLDRMVRREVRKWLHLPKDTPDAMFYTARADGGLGVTCFHTKIPRLQRAKRERINELTAPDAHLAALRESEYWRNGSPKAPRALGTEVDRNGMGLPCYLESRLAERDYWKQRLYATVDGKGLKDHRGGFNTRFFEERFLSLSGKEFVKAIHLRCGALRTPARSNRGRVFGRGPKCPTCPDKVASLTHLMQNCPRTKKTRTERHNIVCKMLTNKLRKLGYDVREEPRIPSGGTYLKPDIVAYRKADRSLAVLDPTIVSCSSDLNSLAVAKQDKYVRPEVFSWLVHEYGPAGEREKAMVEGVAINFRGAISGRSSDALRALGVRPSFLELLSFRVLKLGGFIYNSLRHRSDWNCGSARDGASTR